ncbi:MAG: hypothetical protein J0M12_17325, partial [Deltaproteobacteria bacterium]|nr:hypothetical protein [Deltaproteobacteria bacterium]
MRFDIHNIDRRIIYALVLLALSIPLINKWSVRPARLKSAEKFYNVVDNLKPAANSIAFVA